MLVFKLLVVISWRATYNRWFVSLVHTALCATCRILLSTQSSHVKLAVHVWDTRASTVGRRVWSTACALAKQLGLFLPQPIVPWYWSKLFPWCVNCVVLLFLVYIHYLRCWTVTTYHLN